MSLNLDKLWQRKSFFERGNGKTTDSIIYFLHNIEFMFEEMCEKNITKDFVVVKTIQSFIFNGYLKNELTKRIKELYPEYKLKYKGNYGIIIQYNYCEIDIRFCGKFALDCDRGVKRENIFTIY